jgi:hypothetical protein
MQRSAFVAMRAVETRCSKVGLRVEAEHHSATPAGLRQRQQPATTTTTAMRDAATTGECRRDVLTSCHVARGLVWMLFDKKVGANALTRLQKQ